MKNLVREKLPRYAPITMKWVLFVLFTTAGFCAMAGNSFAQVLDKVISVNIKAASFNDALDKVAAAADVKFIYLDKTVNQKKVNLVARREKLAAVLERLLAPYHLTYQVSGNNIVIKRVNTESIEASATALSIHGMVSDEKGVPVPGVNVQLKGTSTGIHTNEKGEYSITVPGGDGILVFSFVGYISREIKIEGRASIDVQLQEDIRLLNQVVVVGYGTQKKVNLTGAVSAISGKDLAIRPVGQTSTALQGALPGVTVRQTSGRPGGDGGNIRIRGVGTLSDANPLVLIDGIEGDINNIDANMIESVSVLKDAASASIYGSRAANGVILVTTKRAKGDQLSVNYSGYLSWQTPTNLPDMANAIDHMLLTNEAYVNVGRAPLYSDQLINEYRTQGAANRNKYPDTDWQREVLTGSGIMQSHFVSLNGGSGKIRFITSLGYLNQQGIIENSGFKRYSLRNNADITFSKKLNLRFDLQVVNNIVTEPGAGSEEVFHWMNRIPANQVGINADGTWGEGWNGTNPIAMTRDGGVRKNNRPVANLNVSLNYQPTEWLKVELTAAPQYVESINKNYYQSYQTYLSDGTPLTLGKNSLTEDNTRAFYNTFRGLATFEKAFGEHHLKVMAGASREDYNNNYVSAYRDDILTGYPVLDAGAVANQRTAGNATAWALQSFFGRINYDYRQKYLLEINGRYDGSSRFATGHKYGVFPSVSGGWRVSEEKFMQSLSPVLNELKLRASWGQLGNQNIGGNYPFASYIDFGSYSFDDNVVRIAALNQMANAAISWETTEMTNFGVDMTLFKNLSVTADYYIRRTKDILLTLDIPLIIGLGAPFQNAGVVDNKGWEVGLTYKGAIKKFQYDVSLNLSDVKNKIIDLHGINKNDLTINREGYPIQSIYGLQAEGYFQNTDEISKHATQFGNVAPGDLKYKDQNDDGIINDADNVIIGSTIPRYTFGANFNFSYKGFNLNLFLQGVGKADGYLYQHGIMPFYNGGTVQEQHKDHWTPEHPDAAFPRLAFSESNNEKNSSFWLKNAAYMRLKNLRLGYTISSGLAKKAGIQRLNLYVNAQNLFTADKFWDGYDVESPVGVGKTYPQEKVYGFGIEANF